MATIIFDGVAYGMLLFLLSVGLSVTMGLMNFVNLAHGVFAMVGGYAALAVVQYTGAPFFLSLLVAFVAAMVMGGVLEFVLFRRLYAAHALNQVLLSIGVVFVAVAVATFIFGPSVRSMPLPLFLQGQIAVFSMDVGRYRLFLISVAIVLVVILWYAVARTRYGAMVRAAVDNPMVAGAMGIHVPRLFFVTFALGCGLAGLGGALSLDLLGMEPTFALKYMVYFLLVVSVGGAGTLVGPFLAALLVGIVDTAGKYYFPQMGGFLVYLLMVIILLWRPHGLVALKSAAGRS